MVKPIQRHMKPSPERINQYNINTIVAIYWQLVMNDIKYLKLFG